MSVQPSGTVTLLFTDIEGSTRLWEKHAEAMRTALRRHDEILRESIEQNGGYVFKTVGDAFCASFIPASDAVLATMEIQHRVRAEKWELPSPIRVRVALHTGNPEVRDRDYFGPPVNRCARLLSLAAGGQSILSLVTEELVRDSLPEGAVLRDLGMCRLKDLARPEKVYELRSSEFDEVFPPPKTLDSHPHNLPLQPTPLIGRERDLDYLENQILEDHVRLLTLVGPGGIGKTRMSLQIAADVIEHFPDGAYVVDLASVRDPKEVPRAIMRTLQIADSPDCSGVERLREWLGDRHIMLILDNLEQVIDSGGCVSELLATCLHLKLIVTSRQSLRIRGEHVCPVSPLALPDMGRQEGLTADRVSQYESVRLFIARAVDVNPSFIMTNGNAPAIAEICVRLDGLPLALELAAARLAVLTPESLLKHLGQRLKILTGGARDLPARQQTLMNTISWSYELLGAQERVFLQALSVFSGGFTIEACECLVSEALHTDVGDVLGLVQALADKSLVSIVPRAKGESRFRLLETIREFGLLRLNEGGMKESLSRRHAQYYLKFAEEAQPKLEGPDQKRYFDAIDQDAENIRAAADYLADLGEDGAVVSLVTAIGIYWQGRGFLSETRTRLDQILRRGSSLPDQIAALALIWTGIMAIEQHDFASAKESLERAIELARAAADPELEANALEAAGWNFRRQRDLDAARALETQALELAKVIENEFLQAKCSFGLIACDLWSGKTQGMRERLDEVKAFFHRGGHLRWEGHALNLLGVLAYYEHDLPAANALCEQSRRVLEHLGDAPGLCLVHDNLGESCLRLGENLHALEHYSRLTDIAQRGGVRRSVIRAFVGKAETYLALEQMDEAVQSIEQARQWMEVYKWAEGHDRGWCLRVSAAIKEARGDRGGARDEYSLAVAALRGAERRDPEELQLAEAGLERVLDHKGAGDF